MAADEAAPTALRPWRVVASRHVVDDRWISLRADRCVTATGHVIEPFYILDYADWVSIVAIDAEDHLVMVRQYRHGSRSITLELPGGGVDAADADPIAAAKRELAEETGYTGGDWRLVGSMWPNPSNQSNRCHAVLATGVRRTATPDSPPDEQLEVVRLPVDEAVGLALAGRLEQAMHIAALALALTGIGRWPGQGGASA